MKGFDIIHFTNGFKLEIVFFALLVIIAVTNIFNITLEATNVFSDQSLEETKQQRSEKVAEGGVESTTMKHIMINSQQSFNSQDIKIPTSRQQNTDLGTEAKNTNNWITVNHDIYGTRSSNQMIINKDNKDNVGKLQVG